MGTGSFQRRASDGIRKSIDLRQNLRLNASEFFQNLQRITMLNRRAALRSMSPCTQVEIRFPDLLPLREPPLLRPIRLRIAGLPLRLTRNPVSVSTYQPRQIILLNRLIMVRVQSLKPLLSAWRNITRSVVPPLRKIRTEVFTPE